MRLRVGAWMTEEWLEQLGPQLLELGFRVVEASTDKVSPGLYENYLLDYVGEEPLPYERLDGVLQAARERLETAGQQLDVAIVQS